MFYHSHLAHALLFHGPEREGLKTAAQTLAQAILCEDKKNGSACGVCRHCRQAEKGVHADLLTVEAEEDSPSIKIEQIRQVIARANLKPLLGNYKVFIIHDAHSMNEAAQNAILKILEEPPSGTFFILLSTHPESLLDTVRSRCQAVSFGFSASEASEPDELDEYRRAAVTFTKGGDPPDLSKLERGEITQVLDHLIEYLGAELAEPVRAGRVLGQDEDSMMEKIELLGEFKEKISQNINVKLALAVLWTELAKK